MLRSECGHTISYQTDNNLLPSMEQQHVKLKSEVTCEGSVLGPHLFLIHIFDRNNQLNSIMIR